MHQSIFIFTQSIEALFDNTYVLYLTRYGLCVGCAIQILFSLWVLLHVRQTYLLYLNIFQGILLGFTMQSCLYCGMCELNIMV